MNFKQLLITTMACSAMTQFAMADIVLQDSNWRAIRIDETGVMSIGPNFDYDNVKNITVSGTVGNKGEVLEALRCIFERAGVASVQGVNLIFNEVTDSDSLSKVLGYLFKVRGNVSGVSVSSLEKGKTGGKVVQALCDILEREKEISIKGAKLELEGKLAESDDKVFNIGPVLRSGISELTVKDVGKVCASEYGAVEKINIEGKDTLWSDLWFDLQKKDEKEAKGCFDEHHGGFITVIKIPGSLKELNYNAKPWDGGTFSTYKGYSGLALYTEEANESLKLKLNGYTSSVYFVLDDKNWKKQVVLRKPIYEVVKFMSENQINILGNLRVADGCYQTLEGVWNSIFVVDEKNVETILAPKGKVSSGAVKQIDSNGVVSDRTVNGKNMSLDDRTKIIEKFNNAK